MPVVFLLVEDPSLLITNPPCREQAKRQNNSWFPTCGVLSIKSIKIVGYHQNYAIKDSAKLADFATKQVQHEEFGAFPVFSWTLCKYLAGNCKRHILIYQA